MLGLSFHCFLKFCWTLCLSCMRSRVLSSTYHYIIESDHSSRPWVLVLLHLFLLKICAIVSFSWFAKEYVKRDRNWKTVVTWYSIMLPKGLAELTCLIRPKMGIVSCPTLSITKLLNQQEAGCIHLGSKRSFLMRRRSVFHHIYPPNSKKVWCCIWWKVERPTFVLVPLFCLPKRKHCKQPVS